MGKLWVLTLAINLLILAGPAQSQTCQEGQLECGNSGECIPEGYLCDAWLDCHNGWDESKENCPCDINDFRCSNTNTTVCLPSYYVCDGKADCPNGADEIDCPPCSGFTCADNGECIPGNYRCDDYDDCADGSDEKDCPTKPPGECWEDEFKCGNGDCIPGYWACDGLIDCDTDELDCPCDDGFRCESNGLCISADSECNGVVDCLDFSDERNCTCDDGEINCGVCINPIWICDYVIDCPDASDEENCNFTIPHPPEAKLKLTQLMHENEIQKKYKNPGQSVKESVLISRRDSRRKSNKKNMQKRH